MKTRLCSSVFLGLVLSAALLLALSACSPRVAATDTDTTTGPAATAGTQTTTSTDGTIIEGLLAPYDYGAKVYSDFIFKGEILSVETEEVHGEYTVKEFVDGGVYTDENERAVEDKVYSSDGVHCFMRVRIDKVFVGVSPSGKDEIIVYCPTCDVGVVGNALTLSPGKEYVFFSRYWDDAEMLHRIDYFNYESYEFPKRSDVFIRHPAENLAIAKDGYIITDKAWVEVVAPSKPSFWDLMIAWGDKKPTDKQVQEKEKAYAEWLDFAKDYAVHDPATLPFCSFYTEDDFAKALDELRGVYEEEDFNEKLKRLRELYPDLFPEEKG